MFPLMASSQDASKIGLTITPSISYRTLDASNVGAGNALIDSRNGRENPRFGYMVGLNYAHQLSNRLTAKGGVHFADRGYRIDQELNFSGLFGQDDPAIPDYQSLTAIEHHYYLDMPLSLQFHFSRGKWSFYGFTGGSANIFLGHQKNTTVEYEDGSTDESVYSETEADFESLNVQVLIGAGVSHQLSERFQLNAEPIFRHSVNSFVDEPVKGYFWSGGLEIGGYYRF